MLAITVVVSAGKTPTPGCATAKYTTAYQVDTVYCVGIPLNVGGIYYIANANFWKGTTNAGTPKSYTVCCGLKP